MMVTMTVMMSVSTFTVFMGLFLVCMRKAVIGFRDSVWKRESFFCNFLFLFVFWRGREFF